MGTRPIRWYGLSRILDAMYPSIYREFLPDRDRADHPGGMRRASARGVILAEAGWKRRRIMSGTGWLFTGLGILYLVLLFTLAVLSFRKGHWVLGLIGFIFPILWIIGAIMPDRRRRRYR